MIRTRIAQRYARALFELAQDAGTAEEIGAQLATFQDVVDSDETVRTALLSPVLTRAAKQQVVEAYLEAVPVDPLVGNFLRVLLEARKLSVLPDMVAAYAAMVDAASGRVRGEALTRIPLKQPEVEALAKSLAQALNKKVELSARLDPSLLGGVVVRVGNLVFDGSLRTQLQRMRETLIKG